MKKCIERLKQIKEEKALLQTEQEDIELNLTDLEIYENEDSTWTRFTRNNNIQDLYNGKTVWKSCGFSQYSTKIEILKNKPKELK